MGRLTPAQVVIQVFGGIRATARIVGVNPSTVSRWQAPKDKNGSGGYVPGRVAAQLLELARDRSLPLSAEDLILGRGA